MLLSEASPAGRRPSYRIVRDLPGVTLATLKRLRVLGFAKSRSTPTARHDEALGTLWCITDDGREHLAEIRAILNDPKLKAKYVKEWVYEYEARGKRGRPRQHRPNQ